MIRLTRLFRGASGNDAVTDIVFDCREEEVSDNRAQSLNADVCKETRPSREAEATLSSECLKSLKRSYRVLSAIRHRLVGRCFRHGISLFNRR